MPGEPFRRFHAPARGEEGTREILLVGMVNGPGDLLAESRSRGASLAIDRVNAGGGCGGMRLGLLEGEVESPWASSAEIAREMLFEKGCLALITPPDRTVSHLMEQVATRGHVPLVALSGAPSLTRVPVPWLARIVPDARAEMEALIRALPAAPEGSIPAIVPSGREGERIRGDLRAVGRVLGVAFGPVIESERSSVEARAAALGGRESGPIVIWLTGEEAADVLELVKSTGWKGPVLLPREFVEEGGADAVPADGPPCLAVRIFDPAGEDAGVARFVRAYVEAYGVRPDGAAAAAYDAVSLLAEAIRSAGPDRPAIRDRLAEIDEFRGVTGRIRFDGTGNRTRDLSVIDIHRGRVVVARRPESLSKGEREAVESPKPPRIPVVRGEEIPEEEFPR